jgi:phage gp16-like protein
MSTATRAPSAGRGSAIAERNRDLARIHALKRELELTDEDYRAVIWTVAQVRSSGDLDVTGRRRLIDHLAARAKVMKPAGAAGAKTEPRYGRRPRTGEETRRLMSRVEAHLTVTKRPWTYAHAMAKRMFGRERVEWLAPHELLKLVAALEIDARRHGRWTPESPR